MGLRVDTTACKLCPKLPTNSCSRPLTGVQAHTPAVWFTLGKMDLGKRPLRATEADPAQQKQEFLSSGYLGCDLEAGIWALSGHVSLALWTFHPVGTDPT